jgi:hypothetical protein
MTIAQGIFIAVLAWCLTDAALRRNLEQGLAGIALLAAAILSPLVEREAYVATEVGVFFIDLALFSALAAIAVRSPCFWPIWASGLQLCTLAVHLAAAKYAAMVPAAYAEALVIWSFPVLAVVALGPRLEQAPVQPRHGPG